MTTSLRSLADIAYATYYATEPDIDRYLRAELMLRDDEPLTRSSLIRAIDDESFRSGPESLTPMRSTMMTTMPSPTASMTHDSLR